MKKTAIACGLLAAFAIVSCQVQEQEFAVEEGLTLCRFTVGAEPTKTTMDEHSSVPFISWTTGDKVSVFDAALANRPFEALEDGASTTLEGSMTPFEGEGTYYAVYPYSEDNSLEGTVVTMQLPDKRSVSAAGLAPGTNLSAAKGDGNGMTFYNLCGLLRITVPEDVTTLAKVKISSSGNPEPPPASSRSNAWSHGSMSAASTTHFPPAGPSPPPPCNSPTSRQTGHSIPVPCHPAGATNCWTGEATWPHRHRLLEGISPPALTGTATRACMPIPIP